MRRRKGRKVAASNRSGKKMRGNTMDIVPRYCSVADSLRESCKQVKLMRAGSMPEKTWAQFRDELKKLKDDDR